MLSGGYFMTTLLAKVQPIARRFDSNLKNMPRLSTENRSRALGMLDAGRSMRNVARFFNVSLSTIVRLRRRFVATGSVRDMPRSGRPEVLTPADNRFVHLSSLRNRFRPATSIANELNRMNNTNVTPQTVRNRLRSQGMNARRPSIQIPLTPQHRRARSQWARNHLRWNQAQWRNVLFSDESRFSLDFADRRRRVWRRRNERNADCCIAEHDRFGGGSVMVWGGVSYDNRTGLVIVDNNLNANRYCNEILRPQVLPFIQRHGQHVIFQQDNARAHTARQTTLFLQQNNVNVLEWPARSPDMSPIEHLWDELGRRVRQRHNTDTRQQLVQALTQEWQQIPQQTIRNLIRSMRRRLQACIRNNGGHTSY